MVTIVLSARGEGRAVGILRPGSNKPHLLPDPGDFLAPQVAEARGKWAARTEWHTTRALMTAPRDRAAMSRWARILAR